MSITQFSEQDDNYLEGLEETLSTTLEELEKHEMVKTRTWERIFDLFDRHLSNQPARFVCSDDYVLAREIATGKPTIDAAKLRETLFDVFEKATANRLWNAITDPVRVLNQDKLIKLLERERLPYLLVESAQTPATQTVRRVRRKATAADKVMLQLEEAERKGEEQEDEQSQLRRPAS